LCVKLDIYQESLRPGVQNVSCSLVREYLYIHLIRMWTMGHGETVTLGLENSNRNISYGLDDRFYIPGKRKAIPLQTCTGPEGSRRLRLPDFMTTAHEGGKVVSPTHRPPLPPKKYSWYSFLLEAEPTPGP